jgi:16S rRNA (cytosine1402-N4)-methyltransferase
MSNHYPVMLNEVVENLSTQDGGVFVDGTFGAGGYTRALLESSDCTVVAIDRDPSAALAAGKLKEEFGERFVFISGCFGDALDLVRAAGFEQIDGFVLDVGVSSMQIDQAERGFSFRFDGPLDMRMDTSQGQTAADIVNDTEEEDLANLIYKYGEERLSRRIAKRIVERRKEARIETTLQLADIIRGVVPRGPKDKIDPATRTFQALRIAANDELGELERGLVAAEKLLKEDGRLVIVAFHSLEDGIVKSFFYERSGRTSNTSRYLPPSVEAVQAPTLSLHKRKAVEPSDAEIQQNSRSRSAKLRVAFRTHNKAWEAQG